MINLKRNLMILIITFKPIMKILFVFKKEKLSLIKKLKECKTIRMILNIILKNNKMKKRIIIVFFLFLYLNSNEQVIEKKDAKINNVVVDSVDNKRVKKYLGYKYKWGGDSLKSGVDCSGLTKLIYKKEFDTLIPRTTKQLINFGDDVKFDSIKNFDLILFSGRNTKKVSHVALYYNNNLLHAVSRGSVLDTISEDNKIWINYYKPRILKIKSIM